MSTALDHLRQLWPMPSSPKPITIIGAGGIVRGAHLPAYRKWELPVAGIFDQDMQRAEALAEEFDIPVVHKSLDAALNQATSTVFDIALPPQVLNEVIPYLPRASTALIQKPFGIDFADAQNLATILAEREIVAAINFQLRFTPSMVAVSDAIDKDVFGSITEIEVRLACVHHGKNGLLCAISTPSRYLFTPFII